MRTLVSKVIRPFISFSFQTPLSLLLIFILGCSIEPERQNEGYDPEEGTLFRVEASCELKSLRQDPRVVQVIEAQGGKAHLVLLKDGDAPIPHSLKKLEKKGIEQIEAFQGKGGRKEGIPDIPQPDASSGIDLPDIFDIFTRVY